MFDAGGVEKINLAFMGICVKTITDDVLLTVTGTTDFKDSWVM